MTTPPLVDALPLGSLRTVELGHVLEPGVPNHPSHPPYALVPYYRTGDFTMDGGYGGANEMLLMSGHSGTHLDALGHVVQDGVGYGGATVGDLDGKLAGLAAHGIETVGPIVRRGVLVDVVALRGGRDLMAPVTAADLRAALEASGESLAEGDCVLVHTGWSQHWSAPETYLGGQSGTPGIDVSAAHVLADAGVFLVGGETAVVEHQAPSAHALPVHMLLLARRGVHLLENMDLRALAASGCTRFLFVCLPMRLKGSTGSPVRPIAIL